jgi:hypothetical protein
VDTDYMGYILSNICSMQSSLGKDSTYRKVKYLLENGANPNIGNSIYHNRTPLHHTTEMYQYNWKYNIDIEKVEELSSLLLDYGADPNLQCNTCTHSTPWENMSFSKNIKLIKKFLEKGANPMFHIISYDLDPEQFRGELYRLSIQYLDLIILRYNANMRMPKMVNDKLYYRVGGIDLLSFF